MVEAQELKELVGKSACPASHPAQRSHHDQRSHWWRLAGWPAGQALWPTSLPVPVPAPQGRAPACFCMAGGGGGGISVWEDGSKQAAPQMWQ